MKHFDRLRRIERLRAQPEAHIERVVTAQLRAGWRSLYPQLRARLVRKGAGGHDWIDTWADEFQGEFAEAIKPALEQAAQQVAESDAALWSEAAGGKLGIDPLKIVRDYEAAIGAKIGVGRKGNEITDQTRQKVRAAVNEWYADPDMNLGDLTEALASSFSGDRARLIAVNETTALVSYVTKDVMSQLGLSRWTWQSRLQPYDPKTKTGTCPLCLSLHGKIFNASDPMPPDGSHTGCVLPGQTVAAPGLIAGAQSFYRGWVIEIALADGRKLAVTPNHPILTTRGWRSAESLVNQSRGEVVDIISHRQPERVAFSVNPNYDHRPTLIEQVFGSLTMARGMETIAVPATAEDFHGDGRLLHGHIDIVRPDRELGLDGVAPVSQNVGELSFSGDAVRLTELMGFSASLPFGEGSMSAFSRKVGGARHGFALCSRHAVVSDAFGFGVRAPSDAFAFQDAGDNGATDPELSGHGEFRSATPIGIDDPLFGQNKSGRGANGQSGFGEIAAQSGLSDPIMGGDFGERETTLIQAVRLAGVREFDFSGHVYDLQTLMGWYCANGVIIHNCYCTPAPVVE